MIDQLIQYDTDLFFYLNSLGTPTWDGFWLAYTFKLNWIPFYALLLYLMYKKVGKNPFIITVLVVALMVLFTDQITNLFKNSGQKDIRNIKNNFWKIFILKFFLFQF